jgi:hypothetical protein
MDKHPERRILSADKTETGVLITFDDGQCALYSASLLFSQLCYAESVTEPDPDE